MEYCSIYSHYITLEEVVQKLIDIDKGKKLEIRESPQASAQSKIMISHKEFGDELVLNIRRKATPGYQLSEPIDGITQNLSGMYNYVQSIAVDANQQTIKERLLYKIASINMELGIISKPSFSQRSSHREIILLIVDTLEGIIFTASNSLFELEHASNGILNAQGQLILDSLGKSDVEELEVIIERKYFEES